MIYEKKNKIFLIGFMGCGKTTLGKKIARALQYEFSDLDGYIESVASQTISSIFSEHGENYFRNLESECLKKYDKKYMVIATGGGTPCFNQNMEFMLSEGLCIYIKMPPLALYQRLIKSSEKRPLIIGKTEEELKTYITETLNQREPFYLQSHIVIDGLKLSLPSLLGILQNKLESSIQN